MEIKRKFLYELNDVDEKYILEAQEAVQKERETAQNADMEAASLENAQNTAAVEGNFGMLKTAAGNTDTCIKLQNASGDTDVWEPPKAERNDKKHIFHSSRKWVGAWVCAAVVFCVFLEIGTAMYLQGNIHETEDTAAEEEVINYAADATIGEESGDMFSAAGGVYSATPFVNRGFISAGR